MGNDKEIIFVRHAESLANAGYVTSNHDLISLSPYGVTQAKSLADHFPIVPELIVVSNYLRTAMTAHPLIVKLQKPKVEVWDMIHEFTYLDREKYKGTTTQERMIPSNEYWKKKDPHYKDGPLEENFFDLLKRVNKFDEVLKQRKEKKIAIFSHGQFLIAFKLFSQLNKKPDELTLREVKSLMTNVRKLSFKNSIKNAKPMTFTELVGAELV